jgi:hypothetical protein
MLSPIVSSHSQSSPVVAGAVVGGVAIELGTVLGSPLETALKFKSISLFIVSNARS